MNPSIIPSDTHSQYKESKILKLMTVKFTYIKILNVIVFSLRGAGRVELLNLRVDIMDLCAHILYDLPLELFLLLRLRITSH